MFCLTNCYNYNNNYYCNYNTHSTNSIKLLENSLI